MSGLILRWRQIAFSSLVFKDNNQFITTTSIVMYSTLYPFTILKAKF